jgi:peptidoglycan/LPS O-acetylase OafA/YrhL
MFNRSCSPPLFTCVLAGGWGFGFLTKRALRYLGQISYSVYLIHLPIIALTRVLVGDQVIAKMNGAELFMGGLLVVTVAFVVSSLTFAYIELPFLRSRRAGEVLRPAAQLP